MWLVFSTPIAKAGFGISPPWIENLHAFPGAVFERSIVITQESAPRDLRIRVNITGADVSKWIAVKNGDEIIIPKGTKQYPISFIVTIPKNAPFGFYEGKVDLVGIDPEKGDGQVAIALGAQARVRISVSDEEFSDFEIRGTNLPDIEEGWPLEIRVSLENLGNRPVRPSRVTLRIWDNDHTRQLFDYDITDMSYVDPFQTGESVGLVTPSLSIGQYWGEIEVFKEGSLVLGDRVRFDVLPRWALKQKSIVQKIYDGIFGTIVGIVVFWVLVTLILATLAFLLILKRIKK